MHWIYPVVAGFAISLVAVCGLYFIGLALIFTVQERHRPEDSDEF